MNSGMLTQETSIEDSMKKPSKPVFVTQTSPKRSPIKQPLSILQKPGGAASKIRLEVDSKVISKPHTVLKSKSNSPERPERRASFKKKKKGPPTLNQRVKMI